MVDCNFPTLRADNATFINSNALSITVLLCLNTISYIFKYTLYYMHTYILKNAWTLGPVQDMEVIFIVLNYIYRTYINLLATLLFWNMNHVFLYHTCLSNADNSDSGTLVTLQTMTFSMGNCPYVNWCVWSQTYNSLCFSFPVHLL